MRNKLLLGGIGNEFVGRAEISESYIYVREKGN